MKAQQAAERTGVWDRAVARLSCRARAAGGFRVEPEPRSIGVIDRGRRLVAGELSFAGHWVDAPGVIPWGLAAPDPAFTTALHRFAWLDDLAAHGDAEARRLAQAWFRDWLARYGRGRGPGWTPGVAGRRLMAWLNHAHLLLRATDAPQRRQYFDAVAVHARFLSRRAAAAPQGLPRIEALSALAIAAVTVEGLDRHADGARRALLAAAEDLIDADGALADRCPETLMEIFARLTWVRMAGDATGRHQDDAFDALLGRVAPVLRALRHADGGLPRMHGGEAGLEGRLDAALAGSGIRRKPNDGRAMGFVRLARGRVTVILDAAAPPRGPASGEAHASTLAFEMTVGRRPVVVSCGPGHGHGAEWRAAMRATPAHSTLCLDDSSSATLAASSGRLSEAPATVPVQMSRPAGAQRVEGGHDGYVARHGLTHARSLTLSRDGRQLQGEDYLVTLEDAQKRIFDAALANRPGGLPFAIRFHLHPDIDAALSDSGRTVWLALPSGDRWTLAFDGPAAATLESSVYLDPASAAPRATKQIVLSGSAMEYATRVRWAFEREQEAGRAIRDLVRNDAAWET